MKPGDLIGGKYRLVRQIGEGAMGVVWSAINELTTSEVALKLVLRPRDDLRHRLLREARACGSLSHRHIIEVYDVGQTDSGDPFLVASKPGRPRGVRSRRGGGTASVSELVAGLLCARTTGAGPRGERRAYGSPASIGSHT